MSSDFSVGLRGTAVGHADSGIVDNRSAEEQSDTGSSVLSSDYGSSWGSALWGLAGIRRRSTDNASKPNTYQDRQLSEAIKNEKTGDQDQLYWTRHFLKMGADPEVVLSEPGISKNAVNIALTALLRTDKAVSACHERGNYDMLRAALLHCDNRKEKIGELVEKAYRERKSDILFGLISQQDRARRRGRREKRRRRTGIAPERQTGERAANAARCEAVSSRARRHPHAERPRGLPRI